MAFTLQECVIQLRKNSGGTQSPQKEVIKLNRLQLPNEEIESVRNDGFSWCAALFFDSISNR